jgi:hypothetical protein
MSSIFTGKSALRHNYKYLLAADLATALNPASAAMLAVVAPTGARMMFLDNRLDKEVTVLLVHPEADSTVTANRLLWIEVAPDQVINYDLVASPGLEIDPGAKVFVYSTSGIAPTAGKIKLAWWG